jgi:predicted DNA-binding protein
MMMAISVRLNPALEAKVGAEARRLGITKSEFVKGALERLLGIKDPATLLQTVRSGTPMGDPDASANVAAKVKKKLRAKRPA